MSNKVYLGEMIYRIEIDMYGKRVSPYRITRMEQGGFHASSCTKGKIAPGTSEVFFSTDSIGRTIHLTQKLAEKAMETSW